MNKLPFIESIQEKFGSDINNITNNIRSLFELIISIKHPDKLPCFIRDHKDIISKFLIKVLSLRYTINFNGSEKLIESINNGPCIILGNHPSKLDAQILIIYLYLTGKVHPLVINKEYDKFKIIMEALDAVSIGSILNGDSPSEIGKSIYKLSAMLNDGKSVLVYPAGKSMTEPSTDLAKKSSAYRLLREAPDGTRVFTVVTEGLLGSIFSNLYANGKHNILENAIYGVKCAILSLLFIPKRDINISITDVTEDLKNYHTLDSLNQELERRFNEGNSNQVKYIPHLNSLIEFIYKFFGIYEYLGLRDSIEAKNHDPSKIINSGQNLRAGIHYLYANNISGDIQELVNSILIEFIQENGIELPAIVKNKILSNSNGILKEDISFIDLMDSLDFISLLAQLGERTGLNINVKDIHTLFDLYYVVSLDMKNLNNLE